jgi:hypothetical protein
VAGLLGSYERSLDFRMMRSADNSAENLRALSAMFPKFWRCKSETGSILDCLVGLTDILYQRDEEIIAFARLDLAVAGTGLLSAAPVVDIRAMSAA